MNQDTPKNDHDAALGPPTTTIVFAGAEITLTVNDAKAMERALLAYLASVDTNEVEDRDYLLANTQGGPAWIDADGVVRVAAWILQSRNDSLVLTYRMPALEEAGVVKGYVASLVRDGTWRVTRIRVERIRRRR